MIRILYLDKDPVFYNDLKSWLPDFCSLFQLSFESFSKLYTLNIQTDILLINPDYSDLKTEFLESVLFKVQSIPVIFISESISLPFVVSMMKKGAYNFLHKKKDKSILIESIKEILYKTSEKNISKCEEHFSVKNIIGSSNAIKGLKDEIVTFCGNNLNVHLYGETGTGKELTAEALHTGNFLQKKSLIAVNCGAIPENLIETELFGTTKGAFTDACDKSGLFEIADGTTIFLDEVAELSKAAQIKILRVLENGTFSKVGDTKKIKSSFNLITATNKNLKIEMQEGRFREDLYYRITSLIINIPPLRERKDDIYELSMHFLKEIGSIKKISSNALLKLLEYNWPGNIRELKQAIIRAEYLSRDKSFIDPVHIIFY